MKYEDYLKRPHWQRTRAWHLRWARVCQVCAGAGPTEVHHVHYGTLGRERHRDLLAVHRLCHQALHDSLPFAGLTKGWNGGVSQCVKGADRGATGQGRRQAEPPREEQATAARLSPFFTDSDLRGVAW